MGTNVFSCSIISLITQLLSVSSPRFCSLKISVIFYVECVNSKCLSQVFAAVAIKRSISSFLVFTQSGVIILILSFYVYY